MSKERFVDLVCCYCAAEGLKESAHIFDGAPFVIDDVMISLVYSEDVNAEMFFIYVDLGKLPEDRQEEVCQVLLTANLNIHSAMGATFSIAPESRHVMCIQHYRFDAITTEKLKTDLRAFTKIAHTWRENYFLPLPTPDHTNDTVPMVGIKI